MSPTRKAKVRVQGSEITVLAHREQDYISLTDIARHRNAGLTDDLIRNWLRNRNTIEFLGIWESFNNPDFNPVEFDGFRMRAGLNSFALTLRQWIAKARAIGILSKPGRYGGTYAHKDIAFEFATWISLEFKLFLIKEFQRLKEDEKQPPLARVEPQSRALEAELPYPYGRDKDAPDSGGRNARPSGRRLCHRGRPAQRRPVRPDRKAVARMQPRTRRKHARSRSGVATVGAREHRRDELRVDPHGTLSARAAGPAQRIRNPPNGGADAIARHKATRRLGIITDTRAPPRRSPRTHRHLAPSVMGCCRRNELADVG